MRRTLTRGAVRGAVMLTAAGAVMCLAARAPADNAPPATGDLLIATRGSPSGIVLVNALGGQTQIASFDGTEHNGAFASSIVYPGDGFIYATIDNSLNDSFDALARIDPRTGAVLTLVDQTTAGGQLDSPTGIAVDPASGDLIFTQASQVMRADPDTGSVSIVSELNLLGNLQEIVVDASGTYAYVVDDAVDAVVRVTLADGAQKRMVVNQPTVFDTISEPLDLVLDGTDTVAVAQIAALTRFALGNSKGEDVVRDGHSGNAQVGAPVGIDIDQAGNFVVVSSIQTVALRVSPSGTASLISAGGLIVSPQDVVVVGGAARSSGGTVGGGGGNECRLCSLGGDLSGKAKARVEKVGKGKADMLADFAFDAAAVTWSATIDGKLISGTAEITNKKGTKALLTPDPAAVDTLVEILGNRMNAPDPQPVLILSAPPKLVFKTNKKANKGVLSINVKVETDIGSKTYKGALKGKLKGSVSGS